MGYNLYITRTGDNEEKNHITSNEWLEIVSSDDTLTLDIENGPCFVEWNAHPQGKDIWFDLFEGSIEAKNPDDATIKKMLEIAKVLDAKVTGDDFEEYTEASDKSINKTPASNPLRWWDYLGKIFTIVPARTECTRKINNVTFKQGDRVRCLLRGKGMILKIEKNDQGGCLDTLTVKFDTGSIQKMALHGSGLELMSDDE